MAQTSGLTVRQHERLGIELPAVFTIAEAHQSQVHFSPVSSAVDARTIRVTAVDISSGGLGFNSREFVPRMCEGLIRVFDPTPVGAKTDGSPIYDVVLEQRVKVRRTIMLSERSIYFVGTAFLDKEPTLEPLIEKLYARYGREIGHGDA